MTKPLAIDLFCGLGGWTDGLLAEGYDVIGFDIERHEYGEHRYAGLLAIQDVLTLHGSQFRDAALIVASPPCQAYSYRAMPWKRAKALPPPDNTLFEACFRIQREACDAAGRHIPLIVENVRGAQKWVGRARWNYGSFYLWGDVPALMPITFGGSKVPGFRFDGSGSFQSASVREGIKAPGMNWSDPAKRGQDFTRIARRTALGNGARFTSLDCGIKHHGSGAVWFDTGPASLPSASPRRKEASAMIAKIPLPLSRHIAAVLRPAALCLLLPLTIAGCAPQLRPPGMPSVASIQAQAALTGPVAIPPASVPDFLQSGYTVVRMACNGYFDDATMNQINADATQGNINTVASLALGLMGTLGAGGPATAGAGLGLSALNSVFANQARNNLAGPEPWSTATLIQAKQNAIIAANGSPATGATAFDMIYDAYQPCSPTGIKQAQSQALTAAPNHLIVTGGAPGPVMRNSIIGGARQPVSAIVR